MNELGKHEGAFDSYMQWNVILPPHWEIHQSALLRDFPPQKLMTVQTGTILCITE